MLALTALAVAHAVALLLARMTQELMQQHSSRSDALKRSIAYRLVGTLVYWIFMVVVALTIMSWTGIETAALVALLGSALLAVGLGLQGTLGDIAAGVMLLAANTYNIGDYIEVEADNIKGTVSDFSVLYTRVVDEDSGVTIVVPNRSLYGGVIINHSNAKQHVVVVEVAVSNRNADLGVHLERLRESVQRFPGVLAKPPVTANVASVAPLATNIEVRFALTPLDYQVSGTTSMVSAITTHVRQTLVDAGVQLVDLTSVLPATTRP